MKNCSICKNKKPLSEFHIDARRGHSSRCKQCNVIQAREWRKKNREKYNAAERQRYAKSPARWETHIQRKYNITSEDYADLLAKQNGCCAICKAETSALNETLAVDHCHASGTVRGLLCSKCNRMLGCANDRPEVLRAGADYLINAEAARAWIETVMECMP